MVIFEIAPHNTTMAQIKTIIDGMHGLVKIELSGEDIQKQSMSFQWCEFGDEQDITGFIVSFSDAPVLVTDVAAEQFIRMILTALLKTVKVDVGGMEILNHLGEKLPDVQFLPPTFEGTESDIQMFVAAQDSLKKVFFVYERTNELSSELIQVADAEGVLDDFLCLVQVKASGLQLAVRKPKTEE